MARRDLLNDAERTRLFEVPGDDASLIRLYSLSDADRDFVLSKRGARNQLGMAVQIGLLRYPGFGLRLENEPPAALIQFLAQQIGAPWPVFRDYARRDTTRREHFAEAAKHLGLRPWNRLLAAKPVAAELGRKADEDPLVKACERYMTVRRFAPKFLESFTFRASSDKNALLSAVELLKRLNNGPHRAMPEKPPLSFLPKAWQRLIVKEGAVDRRQYEIATLAVLCRRLASGDIWIEGTRNYQQFDRYLQAKADVTENAKTLAVPAECEDYLRERSRLLDWRLRRFANALRHDRLMGVALRNGVLRVSPTPAITPPEAERLDRALDRLMPRVRITELLHEVARRVDQSRHRGAVGHPEKARRVSAPESTRLRIVRTGSARTHIVHARLAGERRTPAAMPCRLEQGRIAPRARPGRFPSQTGPARRPHVRNPDLSSLRPQSRHRGDRLLEHSVSRARRGPSAIGRRIRSRRTLAACGAARLEPHQPDRRLPLGPGSQPRRRFPLPQYTGRRRVIEQAFMIRPK